MLKDKKLRFRKNVIFCVFYCLFCLFLPFLLQINKTGLAMPFYDLQPQELVLRAEFFTSYSTSSPERKHNIMLASKSLNNLLVAPHEEFSFNKTVGARTEKRGYKTAKIIVGGEFVDGVGGGICQVSTTLYNAVLLAGLKIIEFHPHTLQVGYVEPSFDAMVNSGSADLRFVNDTFNPIIINTFANGERLKIVINGEKSEYSYKRKSIVKEYIEPEDYQMVIDEKGEYPELFEGDSKIIKFQKQGLKSEGVIVKMLNGKIIEQKLVRKDCYKAIRGVKVVGTRKREETIENLPEIILEQQNKNLIYNIYKKPFDKLKIL